MLEDGAVFHDDTRRLRWSRLQRLTIFLLLLRQFGAMMGKTMDGHHLRPATAWRITVEAWLRCQTLIVVRQSRKPKMCQHFAEILVS